MKNRHKILGVTILILFSIVLLALFAFYFSFENTLKRSFEPHKENLPLIVHALNDYYDDHGAYPEELENLTPVYLASVPEYSLRDQSQKYYYGSYLNDTHFRLGFKIAEDSLCFRDISYCEYYSYLPDEFKCTVPGFIPENERINFTRINFKRFD